MPPPLPQLPGVEHHFETVNGVRLHYAEAGSGEPLVLQHGWPQHWWMWRDFIGPLAERYRVIVPDLRGHGWSDKPRTGYLKSDMRDDLIALLDRLGLDRVRLVGHDWGAYAGMLAALSHPERIERFVAIGIPHPWQDGRPHLRPLLAATYQLVVGGPAGRFAMERLNFARLIFRLGRASGSYTSEELEVFETVQREPEAARATQQISRAFLLHEMRPFLRGGFRSQRLTVPTLWMIGDQDVLGRFADHGYKPYADDMTLEFVPGAGHFLPEEKPAVVLERVQEFLQDSEG
jgi:pimeloyl-ACP methyl ester carboxylesterase